VYAASEYGDDELLTEAVTGEAGLDEGPVERGTVPDEPLGAADPVRLSAGNEYPYGTGVYTGSEYVELFEVVTGDAGVDEDPVVGGVVPGGGDALPTRLSEGAEYVYGTGV